jgi:hypothetical protein
LATERKYSASIFFYSRTMQLDIVKVFTPTDAQVFKGVLKLTLKMLQHVSV